MFFTSVLLPFFPFEDARLLCGEHCDITPDPKHPNRWAKNLGCLCMTADRGIDELRMKRMTFKEVLLEVSNLYIFSVTHPHTIKL